MNAEELKQAKAAFDQALADKDFEQVGKIVTSTLSAAALGSDCEAGSIRVIERLAEKQTEIKQILAEYGVEGVRIEGVPESYSGPEPDVDVLVSLDEKDKGLVLVVFRNPFLLSGRAHHSEDEDGFLLSFNLTTLLGRFADPCHENAVKNFHPATYEKTLASHHWKYDPIPVRTEHALKQE